jgi:hypothetical protein
MGCDWNKTRAGYRRGLYLLLGMMLSWAVGCPAAQSLVWKKDTDKVSANIQSAPLEEVLNLMSVATGWEIYVQPESDQVVNVKFQDRPASEALKLLLGGLSYAVLPQAEGPSRLLVFRTNISQATELISPKRDPKDDTSKPIPNELVVTLKPGVNIDDIAKKVDGKVVGRNEELRVYRLQFETAEAAERARKLLSEDPEVAKVEGNYNVERPPDIKPVDLSSVPELSLKAESPANDCEKVIVGLIDTSVPKTGGSLDAFLLPQIDVAGPGPTSYTSPPHGESMASTIVRGADFSSGGKAKISILPVNVYGQNVQANTYDVANGILQAIKAGAKIINLSLGSEGPSPYLAEVIRLGQAQDVIFIAAAGNRPTTTPTYPAADPKVVAVTASDRTGNLASYANRGDFVDVIAPGSTIFQFNGQRYLSSGTSVATAYVSGLAASMADPCNKAYSAVEAQIRKDLSVRK